MLEDYNRKRDFTKTKEPEGIVESSNGTLRFVVQRHAATHLHYDLRLEIDGVLKSWAIPKGPSLYPLDKRLAMQTEDHPLAYRDFQGSIPAGEYGGGEMEIWDAGTYEPLAKKENQTDDIAMQADLSKESLKFILHGEKLKGEFALVKIKNSNDGKSWLLIKHKDAFATTEPYDAEEHTAPDSLVSAHLQGKKDKSKTGNSTVKSFKNYAPSLAGAKTISAYIQPMMAQSAEKSFDGKDWAFEIKWDGYRAIADLRNGTQLYSRNGLDFAQKFKKIISALKLQTHEMVLDGEIVAYDDTGKPNFQWLQNSGDKPNAALVFQVFDLLWLNGLSTESLNFLQRKELLKEALVESETIKYCDHILEKGEDFYRLAEGMGLEGIIAKKTKSTYTPGARSSDWLKIKSHKTEEVIICGYTQPKGSRSSFGSLILGKYEGDELVFCGHAGTGFDDKTLKNLLEKMQPLVTEKSPFSSIPNTNDTPTWLKPELVAEIKYSEITSDHIFRHPVFLWLRKDKTAEDLKPAGITTPHPKKESPTSTPVLRENDLKTTIGQREVRFTNQNKIYFPENQVSKGDMIAYYQSVADFILPHMADRPQSLNRFPNGIHGMSFYQKDASQDTPEWVRTEKIFSESNEKFINYIICNDAATLAYLNNLGCIEMNVWTGRMQNPDAPDYLVLDLDPSENNSFEDVIETAQIVKTILALAGIEGYPKTSGSSGIHIYIPTGALYTYDQVKDFAHVMMQLVQKKLPQITTLERSLQKRDKGKIYLDYLQNRRGQTLASVYSMRPKVGAPVSMPLHWDEVKPGLRPTDFNIENALARIQQEGDLFSPVLGDGIDMIAAIGRLMGT